MAHNKTTYSQLYRPDSIATDKVDSQKMFIDNIVQMEANFRDSMKRVRNSVASIASLKAINTTDQNVFSDGTLIFLKEKGYIYYLDRTSTETADDDRIIAPTTGGGRWKTTKPPYVPSPNEFAYQEGGTASVRTATIPYVSQQSDLLNLPVFIKATIAGSAVASTLNINGYGAYPMRFVNHDGTAVQATPHYLWVNVGNIYMATFDGSYYNIAFTNIPVASTARRGISQLNDSTEGTSTTQSATSNAVRAAKREVLAGSGTTGGTLTAYTLAAPTGVTALYDGLTIRVKLHVASGVNPTMNFGGFGAKYIMTQGGSAMAPNTLAGTWVTMTYSTTTGNFILQGEGGGGSASGRTGSGAGVVSTYEWMLMANFNPYYAR